MGQQQLLLLVLGVLVVLVAVVVGLLAFAQNRTKANADALLHDGMRIANQVQSWRMKADALGGGAGNPADDPWKGISFEKLMIRSLAIASQGDGPAMDEYETPNGMFTLEVNGTELHINGESQFNRVVIVVSGTRYEDIETEVMPIVEE